MKLTSPFSLAAIGSLLFCCGCTSLMSRRPHEETKPYPGVRGDAHLLAHPKSVRKPPIHPVIVVTYSLIDMPLSAVLDTLLLPIDLSYRKPKAEKSERQKETSQ